VTWLLAIGSCALVACTSAATDTSVGGVTDGPAIFERNCAMCHGPDGKPPQMMIERLNVRDLTSTELRARVTPELVANQVRVGSKNGLMPAFQNNLSETQIAAVAAWVASPGFPARPKK
jgi:mono/diheme cytochrome c family protein